MDLIDSTGFLIGLLRLGCVLKSSGSPSHLELMLTPLEKVIAGLKDAVKLEKSSLKVAMRQDKQRGVYTTRPFRKGQFVAEYAGEFVTMAESLRRENEYQLNGEGCYILNISKEEAVDASRYFHRIGRLINHASSNPNLKLHRPLTIDGKKQVPFVALRDCS